MTKAQKRMYDSGGKVVIIGIDKDGRKLVASVQKGCAPVFIINGRKH